MTRLVVWDLIAILKIKSLDIYGSYIQNFLIEILMVSNMHQWSEKAGPEKRCHWLLRQVTAVMVNMDELGLLQRWMEEKNLTQLFGKWNETYHIQ